MVEFDSKSLMELLNDLEKLYLIQEELNDRIKILEEYIFFRGASESRKEDLKKMREKHGRKM